jgi:hypothetical protein
VMIKDLEKRTSEVVKMEELENILN